MAAYIRTYAGAVPTVKQHLAASRVLCDWLVVTQVLPTNPATSVRGPKHVVTTGKTPVLTAGNAQAANTALPDSVSGRSEGKSFACDVRPLGGSVRSTRRGVIPTAGRLSGVTWRRADVVNA